jgi:predicted Zn-dependent protease
MPAWKLVNRILFQIVLPTLVFSSALATSGCSDPTEAANAKGALAQSQLDSGQLAAARKTIRDAIAIRDDIAELHLLQARIELQARSPGTAYVAYSAALALDSANMEALTGVAELGLQLGHVSESEDATNRILALDPKQSNALLLKGLHDIIKRRYDDAVASADAMLEISRGDENGTILKARALSLMGKPDEAFAVAESARKTTGDTLSLALTLLELYRLRGDGNAMVPLLDRIRQLTPENADYDVDEADTLYKLGSDGRARVILRRRMLDPKLDEKAAAAIARVWKEYDPDPLDAVALGEFAKKAGIPAKKAMARLYLDRNDPARANVVLSGAPAIDDIVALRARAAVAQGRLDESLAEAETILAKDRTHCDALVAKAQVMLAKRRADDAINASTLATTSCPQMPIAFVTLARAQEADDNKAGVAIAFRDAFDRNDQDSDLVRTYAAWLEQQGQGTHAVSIAGRLTNNAPSLLSGWRLYADLCARTPGAGCGTEAEAGLARARQRFGVDLRSDEPRPTGLFGRLLRE